MPDARFDQQWPDLSLVYAPDRPLFLTDQGIVTGWSFLRAAHVVAALLPDCPIVPVCSDISSFALLLAATMLRGQHVLLSSERNPARLAELALEHNAVCASVEGDSESALLAGGGLMVPDILATLPSSYAETPCCHNPVIKPDALVALVFTSGSTGQPVGHRKYWGGLVTRSVTARVLLDPDDAPACLVGTVPPYHMYGFEALVLQCLNTRVTVVTGSGGYPADWQTSLNRALAPRILVTTPLQLRTMLRSGLTWPAIRRVVSASAPLASDLAAEAEEVLGAEVTEIYGSTETGSVAMRRTVSGAYWRWYKGVTPHERGEGIEISAPGVPSYVLADFIQTRDDGTFLLLGRMKDVVKLGGKRSSLAALNAVLNAIPGVEDGAFLPPEGDSTNILARMQVFAVSSTLTDQNILRALREQIEPVFLPRSVRLVPALPRNALGKLTLKALRAMAGQVMQEEEAGSFTLPSDHSCLPGHFPGNPVVPGILLLEAGLEQLGQTGLHVDMVKFLHPVLPGQKVVFQVRSSGSVVRLTARLNDQPVMRVVLKAKQEHATQS
ncbi:AMP-binding protein [Acetobacter fabarum]|uniref:AMP-binding protein n=1 Tax=Acetobacter fabarum TaxID=483199 RepID=UPI00312B351F